MRKSVELEQSSASVHAGDPSPEPGALVATRNLAALALWLGLLTGLVEGLGWMVIQQFDRLTNLWTAVIWIAPLLDGLVFLVAGVLIGGALRLLPRRWQAQAGVFAVSGLVAVNVVALTLFRYVHLLVLPVLVLGLAAALTRILRRDEAATLRLVRRTLPIVAGVVLALLAGLQSYYILQERARLRALPPAPAGTPDVVVVVIDALRADHVSAYGYRRPTSPFIDRMAAAGVLFERALSPAPYSLPSHASLLSGLYSYQHGVEWLSFNAFRDGPYPSIAEALRDRGYRTGAFSSNPFWFTREQGFGRGFLHFDDFYHSVADMAYRTVFGKMVERIQPRLGFEQIPARKEATEGVDRVLAWIDRDASHPVFAFINLFDVHDPYTPPEPYRSRFSHRATPPGGILNWRIGRELIELTPDQRASEIEAYDGALAYVDDQIKRLYESLQARRPGRGLLLVITSDHGEAFNEHGGYLHARSLYREETLVPLVIRGPGVPDGMRIARPVTNASIPATILDLVSAGTAPTFGSPSLAPLWRDSSAAGSWPYPMAEVAQRDWAGPRFPVNFGGIRALMGPRWHYIANDSLPDELYAWPDRTERANRLADTALTAVVQDFRTRLEALPPVIANRRHR